jgi:hypothetical protein
MYNGQPTAGTGYGSIIAAGGEAAHHERSHPGFAMSDHTKKPESGHAYPSLNNMKSSEGLTLAEASKARSDSAAADKSKRESGKNKKQQKR